MLDDDKWCVNQLITPKVFIERYRNYKLDLMDKTHIDETAQQVLKIAENAIKNVENAVKNAFKGNAGCVRGACVDFKTVIDHVDVTDIVYPGYTFWYDEYGNIGAKCSGHSVIEVNAIIDDAVNKMNYCFASLEIDVLTALKGRFEKETQVKSFDNPAIEMWVSDRGDVYLRGKLNVTVSNHNGFSDDDVDYIEGVADDVMTNNVDKVTDITWYAML